jgi:hypothetical protein
MIRVELARQLSGAPASARSTEGEQAALDRRDLTDSLLYLGNPAARCFGE